VLRVLRDRIHGLQAASPVHAPTLRLEVSPRAFVAPATTRHRDMPLAQRTQQEPSQHHLWATATTGRAAPCRFFASLVILVPVATIRAKRVARVRPTRSMAQALVRTVPSGTSATMDRYHAVSVQRERARYPLALQRVPCVGMDTTPRQVRHTDTYTQEIMSRFYSLESRRLRT
jgi:hypothetical protein